MKPERMIGLPCVAGLLLGVAVSKTRCSSRFAYLRGWDVRAC
jgi:hypothetical protein